VVSAADPLRSLNGKSSKHKLNGSDLNYGGMLVSSFYCIHI
jgi:hypothetical protein